MSMDNLMWTQKCLFVVDEPVSVAEREIGTQAGR